MPTEQTAQSFATILALPVAKLQADAVTTDTTSCFLSLASDEDLSQFAIHQDIMVVVRPKNFGPDVGVQSGGSKVKFRIDGIVTVSIWSRLWVDQAARDTSWLTHATLGVAGLVHSVTDSLEQYMPTDSNSAHYFIQPMRLLPPGWQFPMKKVGEWGVVSSDWSIVWQENLTGAT